MLLQGRPRCARTYAATEGQAHDAARAYAERTSQTHEVDSGAAAELGRRTSASAPASVVQWQLENIGPIPSRATGRV